MGVEDSFVDGAGVIVEAADDHEVDVGVVGDVAISEELGDLLEFGEA